MPVPRIKVIVTGTVAQLQAAKTIVQSDMPVKGKIRRTVQNWDQVENIDGTLTYVLDFEFKLRADGQTVWALFVSHAASVAATGVQGVMHYHQCSHEDPIVRSCNSVPDSSYQEVQLGA
jgi:hypothetical protein